MLRTCYYIWWYFVHITACKTLKFLVCKKLHIMKLFMHGKIKKVTPGFNLKVWKNHRTIYSETTFLESCRKVVREIWFEKSGWPEKKIRVWRTTFLQKRLQNKWSTFFFSIDNPSISSSNQRCMPARIQHYPIIFYLATARAWDIWALIVWTF